jgi:NADH dehydrogenase
VDIVSDTAPKRILVLGGGFGGVYAALELEHSLARAEDVQITFVNRDNFFLFTPMLHEVAASDLDLAHIANPIRKLLKRAHFFHGDVEAIDLARQTVTVSHGTPGLHSHDLAYDYLVLALGSITNFFNLPGLAECALTMKSLGDAIHLRNRMIALLEQADSECAAGAREQMLTFVVAGGGFAGVETVASMNDFLREALPHYPHLTQAQIRVLLVHPGEYILPELGEELGRYAAEKLAARGVEIRTSVRVTGVTDDGVALSDGTAIESCTLVWTAGTSPNPLLADLPCAKERGRVRVNEYLEVPEWPRVYAVGDCAAVPDLVAGGYCPPTAQHALRQAKVLAKNLTASIRGGTKTPFRFETIGQLASIGRRTGVAQIKGVKFSGFVAWWLWRTIYLAKLPRFEKKLRVALDWTLDLCFAKDLVQSMTFRAPTISNAEPVLLAEPTAAEPTPREMAALRAVAGR